MQVHCGKAIPIFLGFDAKHQWALMKETVENGRSTPGPEQKNDVRVRWEKFLDADKGKRP